MNQILATRRETLDCKTCFDFGAEEGMGSLVGSCSRNAHDENVLVQRAQSRIDQATLENEMGVDNARSGRSTAPIPREKKSKLGGSMYIVRRAQ